MTRSICRDEFGKGYFCDGKKDIKSDDKIELE